jgi:Zn-finger nucleic acid-binding protein
MDCPGGCAIRVIIETESLDVLYACPACGGVWKFKPTGGGHAKLIQVATRTPYGKWWERHLRRRHPMNGARNPRT